MGYQEVLIKSSKLSCEQMAAVIQKKMDQMFIDSADTIATLRNDFISNKMIIFGKEVNKDTLNFKAGDQFLVVCGERSAVTGIKDMFPVWQKKSIEVYPIERIMKSDQYINKDYGDVFKDSKIVIQRASVLGKLYEHKEKIASEKKGSAPDKSLENKKIEEVR